MPSDGLCFVCRTPMAYNDKGNSSVEFVGDAQFEHGRYATHGGCAIGLRHQWLTRGGDWTLVPLTPKNAPARPPWYQRLIARFFAWGAATFQTPRRFE